MSEDRMFGDHLPDELYEEVYQEIVKEQQEFRAGDNALMPERYRSKHFIARKGVCVDTRGGRAAMVGDMFLVQVYMTDIGDDVLVALLDDERKIPMIGSAMYVHRAYLLPYSDS